MLTRFANQALRRRLAPTLGRFTTSQPPGFWDLHPSVANRFNEEEMQTLRHRFTTIALQDKDGDSITVADIQQLSSLQGIPMDVNTALTYIKEVDTQEKGSVSWQDFVQMIHDMKTGMRLARLASMCFPEHSLWDDENLEVLFKNNRDWVAKMKEQDPEYFSKLKNGQSPRYLFIGCADSRVPAQELMGMKAGEMFVHRNVANLVVPSDLNLLSVISYGVEVLQVKDVIVCGHYDCGGVKAASARKDHGLVEHWIRNIRDVARLHAGELAAIKDPVEYHRRMVELNVQEQCLNLFANPIIQHKQAVHGLPRVHGFVYDVGEGLLKRLDVDWKNRIRELREFYDTGHFSDVKSVWR